MLTCELDNTSYLRHAHDLAVLAAVDEARRATSARFQNLVTEQLVTHKRTRARARNSAHKCFCAKKALDWTECQRELTAALAGHGSGSDRSTFPDEELSFSFFFLFEFSFLFL